MHIHVRSYVVKVNQGVTKTWRTEEHREVLHKLQSKNRKIQQENLEQSIQTTTYSGITSGQKK